MRSFLLVAVLFFSCLSVGYANEFWDSQLMKSAMFSDTEAAVEAVAKGADINVMNEYGDTPLIIATDLGNYDIAKLLVDSEADINAVNKHGYTALLIALTNGQREIGRMLIRAGADIEKENIYGTTPLMYLRVLGFFTVDEYLSDSEPNFAIITDDRGARVGNMTVDNKPEWLNKLNEYVQAGDYDATTKYLVEQAEKGNHEAAYMLGTILLSRGNVDNGMIWLRMASQTSDAELLYRIGSVVITDNVVYNAEFGVECFKRSMDAGLVPAKTAYAECLLLGIGLPRDYMSAYSLFEQAAEAGDAEAYYYMGMMHLSGLGVDKLIGKGNSFVRMAALGGYQLAIEHMQEKEFENFMLMIDGMNIEHKPEIKALLPSMGAPLVESSAKCDTYKIGAVFNNVHNIDSMIVCYPGDGSVQVTYTLSELLSSLKLEYLESITKNVKFEIEKGY